MLSKRLKGSKKKALYFPKSVVSNIKVVAKSLRFRLLPLGTEKGDRKACPKLQMSALNPLRQVDKRRFYLGPPCLAPAGARPFRFGSPEQTPCKIYPIEHSHGVSSGGHLVRFRMQFILQTLAQRNRFPSWPLLDQHLYLDWQSLTGIIFTTKADDQQSISLHEGWTIYGGDWTPPVWSVVEGLSAFEPALPGQSRFGVQLKTVKQLNWA